MRSRLSVRLTILILAVLFLLTATVITTIAAQQAQGGRGRGAPNPLLSQPAPRLQDGTINLGRDRKSVV